jgi:MFS family permease
VTTGPWRCLRSRSFALWSGAHLLSGVGTWMQLVAQSLLVLQLTHSPALTGLTASLQAAPGLVLGLVGGAAVDAWPRKLTAGVCQALLGVVALATAGLAALHLLSVPILMALAVVSGVVATVDGPAVALLGNELVDEADVPSAIALGSIASSAGRVLGTALAGAAIALGGVPTAYAINGLTFLAVAAVVPFVHPVRGGGAPAQARGAGGLRAGFDYLRGSRALLALIGIGALTSMLGRNYSLSFAALVTGPMHAGAGGYSAVTTTLAVGAIAGAVLAGRLRSARVSQVAVLAVAGAALQIVAAGALGLPMLIVVTVPLAIAESVQDTLAGTLLQTVPPAHLRGRVFGAWQTASAAWNLAGPPLLGWLLEAAGVRSGLALAGAVTAALIGVGLVARRRPSGNAVRVHSSIAGGAGIEPAAALAPV